MEKEVTSKQFSLNVKDFLRGLLMAVGSGVLTFIYTSVEAGGLEFDFKAIGKVAVITAITYLAKNYLQPAQVKQTISNSEHDEIKSNGAASAAK